jgi:polysaccharide export outer membrane protein
MKLKLFLITSVLCFILVSCGSTKEIPYVIDADKLPENLLKETAKYSDPIVQPGDILQILVTSNNVEAMEAVKPFNKATYWGGEGMSSIVGNTTQTANNNEGSIYYYLVDDAGNIEFPMLGKVHVDGLKTGEISDLIASKIYPKYVTAKPGVEVRFRNFKVYALGEFNKPGVISSANGKMNILEAVAQAGDLTIFGVRKNVMVIRTNADGSRKVFRLDLTDKNLLLSPGYNLQQNDVIYVQPNKAKARSAWTIAPGWTFATSVIGTLVSISTLVITLTK